MVSMAEQAINNMYKNELFMSWMRPAHMCMLYTYTRESKIENSIKCYSIVCIFVVVFRDGPFFSFIQLYIYIWYFRYKFWCSLNFIFCLVHT